MADTGRFFVGPAVITNRQETLLRGWSSTRKLMNNSCLAFFHHIYNMIYGGNVHIFNLSNFE